MEFEQYVLGAGANVDSAPTVLRIATAYGLSQRMRFDLTISEFTRTLATATSCVVYDADTWRPYCHVADISKAIITVLTRPRTVRGEVFNVGHTDENYTKRMVVEAVQEHLGGSGRGQFNEGGRTPATTASPSTRSASGSASSPTSGAESGGPLMGRSRGRVRRRRGATGLLHEPRHQRSRRGVEPEGEGAD